jgi:hypothetical protein
VLDWKRTLSASTDVRTGIPFTLLFGLGVSFRSTSIRVIITIHLDEIYNCTLQSSDTDLLQWPRFGCFSVLSSSNKMLIPLFLSLDDIPVVRGFFLVYADILLGSCPKPRELLVNTVSAPPASDKCKILGDIIRLSQTVSCSKPVLTRYKFHHFNFARKLGGIWVEYRTFNICWLTLRFPCTSHKDGACRLGPTQESSVSVGVCATRPRLCENLSIRAELEPGDPTSETLAISFRDSEGAGNEQKVFEWAGCA